MSQGMEQLGLGGDGAEGWMASVPCQCHVRAAFLAPSPPWEPVQPPLLIPCSLTAHPSLLLQQGDLHGSEQQQESWEVVRERKKTAPYVKEGLQRQISCKSLPGLPSPCLVSG